MGGTSVGNYKKTAANVTSGASSFTFTSEQFESLMRSMLSDMKNSGTSRNDCTNDELEFVAGQVKLNNGIVLQDVLCVPSFKFSLLSIPKLTKYNNCVAIFFPNLCVLQDLTTRKVMGLGKKIAGLYHLLNVPMDSVDMKIREMVESHMSSGLFSCLAVIYNKPVCPNMFSLWHHRLGHLSVSKMKHIQCTDVTRVNKTGSTCLTCPMAKLTKWPFSLSDLDSSAAFHLIHMDTWGLYKVPTNGKFRYFLTIVDDFSRATWTYLMVHKLDAFEILKTFLKFVELQFSTKEKCIRSDNALEFVKGPYANYLANQGIEHQTTCVDRPQQNGRVKRKHMHILEVARALRFQASLPLKFWGDCVTTATYLINRYPSHILKNKTPYELLLNKVLDYSYLKVFGCFTVSTNPSRIPDKFASKAFGRHLVKTHVIWTQFGKKTDKVDYPSDHDSDDEVDPVDNEIARKPFTQKKNLKKPSQAPRGVLVGPKMRFKPVKQIYRPISKKNNANTSGNKKKDVESIKEIKRLIIDGKLTLVDDEGKPLEKVDYSGDHDSENEVEPIDNEMASFLASKRVGYGTNSLMEQWKETYENVDYEYDPYDDDTYEGQEVPNKIQSICDNLDIKVRGRKKK
ncbi:retrovirus-related pol polyprotein from transposon TNT 1-94 [Tanacetum coccineum]